MTTSASSTLAMPVAVMFQVMFASILAEVDLALAMPRIRIKTTRVVFCMRRIEKRDIKLCSVHTTCSTILLLAISAGVMFSIGNEELKEIPASSAAFATSSEHMKRL